LKSLRADVHLLTLTATPIPRTLQMALSGIREMSIIATPPVDRLAVRTYVTPWDPVLVREALLREKYRGGQAYYVAPRLKDLPDIERFLREQVPEVKFVVGHGQMSPTQLEAVMSAFYDGEYDVLVSTTIVESGIDIPTANTLVVHRADMFGLAQLHQLRGRVGRGAKASSCILLYGGEDGALGETAKERLETLRRTEDGFVIAEEDFRLRGGGDPLGLKQSGFPAYRFADPIRHRSLLLAAADDARLLLGRDPDLTSERGQAVRLLEALFDWKNERPSAD